MSNISISGGGGSGDVSGPGSSTDNAIVRFDGIDGTTLQNSGAILSDTDALSGLSSIALDLGATIDEFSTDGTLSGNSDTAAPTEKAVKTYVDGQNHSKAPREYPIDASAFHAVETNFADFEQVTGTNVKKFCRAFDKTTEEYANYKLFLPSDLDTSGTVTFRAIVWAKTAASGKNIGLTFGHHQVQDGEDWDVAYTEIDTGAVSINETQDNVTIVTWTETVANLAWVQSGYVYIRLSRDVSVADNLDDDMYLDSFNLEVPRV